MSISCYKLPSQAILLEKKKKKYLPCPDHVKQAHIHHQNILYMFKTKQPFLYKKRDRVVL